MVTGSRRLENGLLITGSFLARTTSSAIATKFEEEIIRLKELCTDMNIIVEKLRRGIKEDELPLIRTLTVL